MFNLLKCIVLCLCGFMCFCKGVNGSLAEEMAETAQLCCNQGTTYAKSHTSDDCSSSIPPDVPSMFGSLCIFAMDQCCKEYFQKKRDCDIGVEAVISRKSCDVVKAAEKSCCDECAKGTAAGKKNGLEACVVKTRGTSAEDLLGFDAYEQCCKKAAKSIQKNAEGDRGRSSSHGEEKTNTVSKPSGGAVTSLCEDFAPNELCAHHCIPVPGSYKCECNPGFMLMADGRNCMEQGKHEVVEKGFCRARCEKTERVWNECFYNSSRARETPSCYPCLDQVVKNRCKPHNPCQHKCNDNGVEVKCSCRRGYQLMGDGKSCEDINECNEDPPVCLPGTDCFNIQGSYKCIPHKKPSNGAEKGQCPPGFTKNKLNNACDDIDECKLFNPPCPSYLCENTIGGYKCGGITGDPANLPVANSRSAADERCPPGFKTGVNEECEDVDECMLRQDDCNPLSQFCINTRGSFYCQNKASKHCHPGFKINPRTNKCEDIDECEEAQDICRADQVCVNVPGEYDCKPKEDSRKTRKNNQKCPDGMRMKPESHVCEDIDECLEGTHLCDQHQRCLNTNGSHECTCKLGFELDPITGACTDLNECATEQHNCISGSQRCDNTVGSFLCIRITPCGTGYILHHTTSECEDIDECALGTHNCDRAGPGYHCENHPGGFRCVKKRATTTSTTPVPEYEYEYYDSEEEEGNQTSSKAQSENKTTPEPTTTTSTAKPEPLPPRTEEVPNVDSRINNVDSGPFEPNSQPMETSTSREPEKSEGPKTDWKNQIPYPHAPPQTPEKTSPKPEIVTPPSPAYPYAPPQTPEQPKHDEQTEKNEYHEPPKYPDQPVTPEAPKRTEPTEPKYPEQQVTPEVPEKTEQKEPKYPDQPVAPEEPRRAEPKETEPETKPEEPRETTTQPHPTEIPPSPTPPQVVYVNVGKETATVHAERKNDGSVVVNTQDVPKNEWTKVDAKPSNCQIGFEMNEFGACYDIDECTTNRHSCSGMTEVCRNTMGGYLCNCAPGFRRDLITGVCDIIITTSSTTSTTPAPIPTSTEKRFFFGYPDYKTHKGRPFRPRTLCDVGYHYKPQSGTCEDINECTNGQANCASVEICINTEGGYRCECPPNWYLDSVRHRCVPIRRNGQFPPGYGNEYIPTKNLTGVDHTFNERRYVEPEVTQLGDSRSIITCPSGYKLGYDNTCEDINECETGQATCGSMVCTNLPGGYVCSCPAGHKLVDGNRCEDVDECKLGGNMPICSQNAECVNTIGSYQCRCHSGFRSAPVNDKVCVDVDECTESPASSLCQHRCNNVWGSYRCSCFSGYRLQPDNSTCADIDECTEFKSKIPCVGRCVNEPGSYRCSCPSGYRLSEDKRSCIDIDECETGEALCAKSGFYGGTSDVCLNTRGGYRCHRISCPPGYKLESKHRCTRIEKVCPIGDWECAHQPTTYSYNFITFVSKLYIPSSRVDLFTMRGPAWPNAKMRFQLQLTNVDAPPTVKEKADINAFLLVQTANQAVVSLVRSLDGPQSIELELSMDLYNGDQFGGIAVAKLYIYVSEYEF